MVWRKKSKFHIALSSDISHHEAELKAFLSLSHDSQEKLVAKLLARHSNVLDLVRKNARLVSKTKEFKHLDIHRIIHMAEKLGGWWFQAG